jgi:uncharacterized protein YjbJ (UPF0337 family)
VNQAVGKAQAKYGDIKSDIKDSSKDSSQGK